MKKVSVLILLSALLLFAGANLIQQNDTEKKAIMAVLAEETSAWYSSDYDRWAATYVHNPDYIALSSSKSGFGITDGWENLAANTSVTTKRQLIKDEKIPLRMKIYDDVAWVVFKNMAISENGERRLSQVVTAFLEKDAGKWKMTYRNVITPAGYYQADNGLLLLLNYGKSMGKTIEEIGNSAGNAIKTGWNQSMGPQVFINTSVSNWRSICQPENFKILEKDDNHTVYTVDQLFPNLKSAGQIYGVTYDEYITFLKVLTEIVADHMGAVYKQENTSQGIKVTVSKK